MFKDVELEDLTLAANIIPQLRTIIRRKMVFEENKNLIEQYEARIKTLNSELELARKGDKEIIRKAIDIYSKEVSEYIASIDEQYILRDNAHAKIFKEIKEDIFEDKLPVENPAVIIIGGQPGSGKTVLLNLGDEGLEHEVKINVDVIRAYHPLIEEIFEKYKQDFVEHTRHDADKWTRELFDYATDNKYNTSLEMSLRTANICKTLRPLKEKGHIIHIKVMAVNRNISRYRTLNRYNKEVESGAIARLVPKEFHDESYFGMLATIEEIVNQGLFDTIQVYTKDSGDMPIFVYENFGHPKGEEVIKAIVDERDKLCTKEELGYYISKINALKDKMERRTEDPMIVSEVNRLLDIVSSKHKINREI